MLAVCARIRKIARPRQGLPTIKLTCYKDDGLQLSRRPHAQHTVSSQRAITMRRGRTFRSGRTRPADGQSNNLETLSRIQSLADYTIDTLESSFQKRQPPHCGAARNSASTKASSSVLVFGDLSIFVPFWPALCEHCG